MIPANLVSESMALMLAVAGCSAIHLASPHQRWRSRPWPQQPARGCGAALLLAAALLFAQSTSLLTLVFTGSAVLMLTFILLTYLGALAGLRRSP